MQKSTQTLVGIQSISDIDLEKLIRITMKQLRTIQSSAILVSCNFTTKTDLQSLKKSMHGSYGHSRFTQKITGMCCSI